MRTLKSLALSLFVLFFLTLSASATQVRGQILDADGRPLLSGSLEFVLGGCPDASGPATLLSGGNLGSYRKVIRAGAGGQLIDQIVGNDQIVCGGGTNTW
jgi:hypothetical protein